MENPGTAAEIKDRPPRGSDDDTSDFFKPESHGPFAQIGMALDGLLDKPESRGWLIVSLVLALILYLVMWFLNDVWYFAAARWNQARAEVATATAMALPTSSPAPTPAAPQSAPTATPATLSTSKTSPALGGTSRSSSTSPPALFCGGMACGAAIVLALVLTSQRRRLPSQAR